MGYDVQQLLTYSQGIYSDWSKKNPVGKFLAPEVPVMTEKFFYKNYGVGNQFTTVETSRAIGGPAARLSYLVTDAQSVLYENALEATIDDIEKRQNPETVDQLQMVKIRDLSTTILNNDIKLMFAFINAAVAVSGASSIPGITGTPGNWSSASIDPVFEVDMICKFIADATGLAPNRIYLDLSSWLLLKNNAKVVGRVGFTQLPAVKMEQFLSLLALPLVPMVGGGAQFVSGSSNNVWIFYGQDDPGQQDPSAFKTFIRQPNRFDNMKQYREERIGSDIYKVEWQQNRLLTGASLVVRIATT